MVARGGLSRRLLLIAALLAIWHQVPVSAYGKAATQSLETAGHLINVGHSSLAEILKMCTGAHAGFGLYGSDAPASLSGRSGALTSGRRLLQTDALGSSASSAASSLQSAVQAVTSSQGPRSWPSSSRRTGLYRRSVS